MAPKRKDAKQSSSKVATGDISRVDTTNNGKIKQQNAVHTPTDVTKQPFYYARQYGGSILGLVSAAGTALYDKYDEYKVVKLVAFLLLMIVGLFIHELRPYRRKSYGDVARERGASFWQMLGL